MSQPATPLRTPACAHTASRVALSSVVALLAPSSSTAIVLTLQCVLPLCWLCSAATLLRHWMVTSRICVAQRRTDDSGSAQQPASWPCYNRSSAAFHPHQPSSLTRACCSLIHCSCLAVWCCCCFFHRSAGQQRCGHQLPAALLCAVRPLSAAVAPSAVHPTAAGREAAGCHQTEPAALCTLRRQQRQWQCGQAALHHSSVAAAPVSVGASAPPHVLVPSVAHRHTQSKRSVARVAAPLSVPYRLALMAVSMCERSKQYKPDSMT